MSGVGEALSVANAIYSIYKNCSDATPKIRAACETVYKIKTWLVTIVEEDLADSLNGISSSSRL
jgi:hypothetical protein